MDDGITRKNSYQFLKEVQAVNTRRKVLIGLTLYSFLLRLCSLDLFFVVLFASNCVVLYFMKNSTKVNLTIAKSSVKSKVGLAKQWAGGLIHKSRNDAPPDEDAPKTAVKIAKKASLFFRGATNTSSNDLASTSEDNKYFRHPNTQSLTPPPKVNTREFKLKRPASIDSITLETHEKQTDGMKEFQEVSVTKIEASKPTGSRKLRTHFVPD